MCGRHSPCSSRHNQVITALDELRNLIHLERKVGEIMAAIDNLNQNVADLKVSVDALVAKASAPVDDSAVQAAADSVAAIKAEVDAALAPVEPAV